MYVNWPQWAQCRSSNSGSSTNSLNTTSGLQRIFDMPPRYRSRTIMAKFLGIYRGVEKFGGKPKDSPDGPKIRRKALRRIGATFDENGVPSGGRGGCPCSATRPQGALGQTTILVKTTHGV